MHLGCCGFPEESFPKAGFILDYLVLRWIPLGGLIFLCHLVSSSSFTSGRKMSSGGSVCVSTSGMENKSVEHDFTLRKWSKNKHRTKRIKADLWWRQRSLQLHGKESVQFRLQSWVDPWGRFFFLSAKIALSYFFTLVWFKKISFTLMTNNLNH